MLSATVWLIIGFMGQALFSARFIVQWIFSEKAGKSIIPIYFWYFSVAGGIVLFSYAIHKQDPVFIAGQGAGLLIYARNLFLIHRDKKRQSAKQETESGAPHED